jgi:hypothetical protein
MRRVYLKKLLIQRLKKLRRKINYYDLLIDVLKIVKAYISTI